MGKVVLAYSGGLDATIMLSLLKEKYGFTDVVPVLVDVGQDEEDIKIAKESGKLLIGKSCGVSIPIYFFSRVFFGNQLFLS